MGGRLLAFGATGYYFLLTLFKIGYHIINLYELLTKINKRHAHFYPSNMIITIIYSVIDGVKYRNSAVLVPLVEKSNGTEIILTIRPMIYPRMRVKYLFLEEK